jgi:hypothetical protein
MTESVEFPQSLRDKVELFERYEQDYRNTTYKEASVRLNFIDPLLEALGWDVSNAAEAPERWKPVVVEPSQEVEGRKRAPDYALRFEGETKLFVEAKKPRINLGVDPSPALQARRYAWSAGLSIVVLTNFSEMAIYSGATMPKDGDGPGVARLHYYKFTQYEKNWDNIASLLSLESVSSGRLDVLSNTLTMRGGKDRIDNVFLRDLEDVRETLAIHLADANPSLSNDELMSAVQLTLDRILFFRICEDRGIEDYGTLRQAAEAPDVNSALQYVYTSADARYNSGLFHFEDEPGRPKPDRTSQSIVIDDRTLSEIIMKFYPPQSPYAFSVMPVEIMGRTYENFLAKRITRNRGVVSLELKPEYRKSGGVFYTPEWLSQSVVKRTLGKILNKKSPESLRSNSGGYRVLDPACGSGSFLVAAYKHLLDWYLEEYLKDANRWLKSRPARLEKNKLGELVLSLHERKRILVEHIFGVDIDPRAVEIAKLSLLVVVLENQTGTGLQEQLAVFKDRILPDLESNIKCGNSLVPPQALSDGELIHSQDSRYVEIRPFDWRHNFGGSFKAIVGNPPWLMAGYEIEAESLQYMKNKYHSYTGKADLYYLFIERCLGLVLPGGRIGLVVPNKMQSTRAGKGIRELLSEGNWVEEIVDFQTEKIFEKATNYTQVILLEKSRLERKNVVYRRSTKFFTAEQHWLLSSSQLTSEGWDINSPERLEAWRKMESNSIRLEDYVDHFGNGVQTGADKVMVLSNDDVRLHRIERQYVRPLLRGKDIRNGFANDPEKCVIFPYDEFDDGYRVLNKYQLERAPYLASYLYSFEEALRKRKWFGKNALELTGEWWGLMYLDSPESFNGTHILTPSLSDRSNFALGTGSMFPTGTAGVTSFRLKSDTSPDALLGLLNSDLISSYIIANSTRYQGGFVKFSAPYLRNVPVSQNFAGDVVQRIGNLWKGRRPDMPNDQLGLIDSRLNQIVNDLYGVSEEQLRLIQEQLAPLKMPQE